MRFGGKLLVLLAVLIWLAGCDIYRYKENQYRQRLERAGGTEQTVSLPAGEVRYWIGGEGPTVLLIHGFGGHALWQWHAQAAPLVEHGARIIAPDLAWFGETVPNGEAFTVDSQVELFVQLMDRLEVDRYDVVGISYGGFVALGMAVRQPDRVERLVLVDSPGLGERCLRCRSVLCRITLGDASGTPPNLGRFETAWPSVAPVEAARRR